MKIGRNKPCPCGSGKKYKKCHGNPLRNTTESSVDVVQSDFEQIKKELMATEKQREKQQGRGRPIVSAEANGYRYIAVGNRLFRSKDWKTFEDFLFFYIRIVLGTKWGSSELKKPYNERNPILQWYIHVCDHQREVVKTPGEIASAYAYGAETAYFHLAYNLYLLGHNARIQRALIKRLKNNNNFLGAYYETFVAAAFIKAGFQLEFENESDSSSSHCEFTATYPETGAQFSVEAKAREAGKEHTNISKQLFRALSKKAEHTRVVFIEMNIEDNGEKSDQVQYFEDVVNHLRACESRTLDGKEPPPAYVIVTNFPYHHYPKTTNYRWSVMAEGLNIPDFKGDYLYTSIQEYKRIEKKHYEIYQLMDSLKEYTTIPSTFDGEIPEFAFNQVNVPRLVIGRKYIVPYKETEVEAILESATVIESKREIMGIYYLEGVGRIIANVPMTDSELRAYKKYPDTFFGVYQEPVKHISSNPVELYDWLYKVYENSTQEKLIEFMQDILPKEKLRSSTREELLCMYCEILAMSIHNRNSDK